jgi:hypothetical protein
MTNKVRTAGIGLRMNMPALADHVLEPGHARNMSDSNDKIQFSTSDAVFFAEVLEGLLDGTETVDSQNVQLMVLRDRLNGE